jgi:hypothetical protein
MLNIPIKHVHQREYLWGALACWVVKPLAQAAGWLLGRAGQQGYSPTDPLIDAWEFDLVTPARPSRYVHHPGMRRDGHTGAACSERLQHPLVQVDVADPAGEWLVAQRCVIFLNAETDHRDVRDVWDGQQHFSGSTILVAGHDEQQARHVNAQLHAGGTLRYHCLHIGFGSRFLFIEFALTLAACAEESAGEKGATYR